MLKLKLQYFDHLMWRTDSLEKTLMLGKIEGGRRGWQRICQWRTKNTDLKTTVTQVVHHLPGLNQDELTKIKSYSNTRSLSYFVNHMVSQDLIKDTADEFFLTVYPQLLSSLSPNHQGHFLASNWKKKKKTDIKIKPPLLCFNFWPHLNVGMTGIHP